MTTQANIQQWDCAVCTFTNGAACSQCGICEAARPLVEASPALLPPVSPRKQFFAPPPPRTLAGSQKASLFSQTMDVTEVGALLITKGAHLPGKLGVRFAFDPPYARYGTQCTLTISADDQDAVGIAALEVRDIAANPAAFKESLKKNKIHVFIDDSNVFFGGLNRGRTRGTASPRSVAATSDEGSDSDSSSDGAAADAPWVDIDAMIRVIQCGRWTEKQLVVGSGHSDAGRWARYKRAGYETQVLERTSGGKEVGVDDTLHAAMLAEANKKFGESRTLVLLTGDGNANNGRMSFPAAAEIALQNGWKVEVWAWDYSTSAAWRDFSTAYGPSGNFSLMLLDAHADAIITKAHGAPTRGSRATTDREAFAKETQGKAKPKAQTQATPSIKQAKQADQAQALAWEQAQLAQAKMRMQAQAPPAVAPSAWAAPSTGGASCATRKAATAAAAASRCPQPWQRQPQQPRSSCAAQTRARRVQSANPNPWVKANPWVKVR
jgi:hypothetical protein